jgi:predicted dehydrogenase
VVRRWQDLSVLIAGCGSIGKRHARVLNGLGVTDLRACDPLETQRASLLTQVPSVRTYATYDEGLTDRPDVVLIGTPPELHVPMARRAILAGTHVLCEKPLSDSTAGIDDLATLAQAEHKKVMVALCFRYHGGLLTARRYLEAGRIGRLVSVRCLVGEHLPDARPDYRNLFSAQHGGAFDLMHEIDLALWYAGLPVREVHALSGSYSQIGIAAPDVAEILIGFDGLCLASIHLDFFQRPRRRQTELIGTEGVILVEFARWDRCTVSVYEAARGEWQHEEMITDRDDMFRAEDCEFLQAVVDDLPIRCTIAEGRKSVEVVLRCQPNDSAGGSPA